jgi:hypothetical protein
MLKWINTEQLLYKPAVLFVSASLGWLAANAYLPHTPHTAFLKGFLPGLYQILFVLALGNAVLNNTHRHSLLKWIGTLFAPVPNQSLGMLLSALLTFTWLLWNTGLHQWDVYELTYLGLSFLCGSAFGAFFYNIYGFRARAMPIVYHIDSSRFDTFMGTLIASIFLGTNIYCLPSYEAPMNGSGVLFFPLALAGVSLFFTICSAILVGERAKNNKFWLVVSSGVAIMMLAIASALVSSMLPQAWMLNGREHTSSDVLFSVGFGLIAGLIAGAIVRFYDAIAHAYLQFVLNKPFKGLPINIGLRILVNIIVPIMPVLIVGASLFLSYSHAGLYGTAIGLLGMLSNVGVSMIIEANKLQTAELSTMQRRKLALVSPELNRIVSNLLFRITRQEETIA